MGAAPLKLCLKNRLHPITHAPWQQLLQWVGGGWGIQIIDRNLWTTCVALTGECISEEGAGMNKAERCTVHGLCLASHCSHITQKQQNVSTWTHKHMHVHSAVSDIQYYTLPLLALFLSTSSSDRGLYSWRRVSEKMQHKAIKAAISTPALSGSALRDSSAPKTLESRLTVAQGKGYQSDLEHS